MISPRNRGWLWALPATSMLVGLLLWPMLYLVRLSLYQGGSRSGFGIGSSFYQPGTWSLHAYSTIAQDHYFWEILGFTLWLGFVVTALCVVLAYPTAHFIWQLPRRWKSAALACVIIPKLSNLLVTVYGLKSLLSDYGPVNRALMTLNLTSEPLALQHSTAGVVIGKTLLVLPYTILLIWAGLERLDRHLLSAARGLGASSWQTFTIVTLPLSMPALTTATLVSLIWALGAFISPYLLGSPAQLTLAVDVQRQMFENMHWPRAAAEGVAMVVTLLFIAIVFLQAKKHSRFVEP